jgi:hypothetical protein
MRPGAVFAVTLTLVLALAGCGTRPEPEFGDWVLPVPEGVPIKEYARIPLEDRSEIAFELVEDLVIGGDPDDPNTAFYRPSAIVAAENGNIFVVERGGKRVQMFAPDGEFLATLGKEGQGPGEFQQPTDATIAGEHLVVVDSQGRRVSVWTDEGKHVADHALPITSMPTRLVGLPDGRLVAVSMEIDLGSINPLSVATGRRATTSVLATYGPRFELLERLIELENPPLPSPTAVLNARGLMQWTIDRMAAPRLTFTVGAGQAIYATSAVEYQVLAMTPEGDLSWALRVAGERRPIPESSKELRVGLLAREDPDVTVDDFQWPERDRAILSSMRSDGRGRLYVYPLLERPENGDAEEANVPEDEGSAEAPRARAVDVYSPQGDLIVAGTGSGTWSYARGDYVYQLRSDPDSEEILAVRYRLVLPGEEER